MSGYGLTTEDLPPELMYVNLPIVKHSKCKKSFDKIRINLDIPHLTDNMFCAGYDSGGKDSCEGDSGSAFVVQENGTYRAIGIVSWGMRACGTPGTYGVYTNVSQYLDWIEKIITENYS